MDSKPSFVMKFLGYGIAWIEDVESEVDRQTFAKSLAEVASESFGNGCIVVPDLNRSDRYLAACPEGHIPGPVELSQISNDDWEGLRTIADESGIEALQERITMLEGHKA